MLKHVFKSRLLIAILAAAIIPFAGIVSCESDSDNSDEGYYISFTLDDTSYKFEKQVSDYVDSDVPCGYFNGEDYDLWATSALAGEDYDCAELYFGDAEATSFDINLRIGLSGYEGSSLTGEVTELGDVDGIISGTFSGNVYNGSDHAVTNGKFRVKRIPEPMK